MASPWGNEFHSLAVDEALGGGSAGPGKSLALLMDPSPQMVVEHGGESVISAGTRYSR